MFKLSQQGRQIYWRLLQATKSYWSAFVFGVLATIILSLIDAGFAWLIKPIINQGFIDRNVHFIRWLPLAVVVIFLVRGIAGFGSSYYIVRVARSVVRDFRQKIFDHLLKMPARFYDQQSSGHVLSTIVYNVEQVAQASSDALLVLLRELALAVGLLIVMFTVSWRLSLFFLVLGPILAWVVKITSRRMRGLSRGVQQAVGDITHVAEEGIHGYKVIRIYGGDDYERDKFNQASNLGRQRELKAAVTNSVGTSIIQVILSVPIAFTLWFATSPHMGISAGAFAAMIAALLQLLRPVRRLTMVNTMIQNGLAGAESIFDLLDKPGEVNQGTHSVARVSGKIAFNHVEFCYDSEPNKPAINDLSFNVSPGEVVALVGRSGAGKSTLVQLLPRFYNNYSGSIALDDVDTQSYELANLRQQFALVSQQTLLFNDTIAHNIAYGAGLENVDEDAIIAAASAAHAMEFINELPDGLNTSVGDNGVLLSGGQRQRIAIARAILKDAPILILDEATSALDSHAERAIQQALENVMRNRTTLVIAHRLSTIEKADKILVLDKGRIIEQGNHQALLAKEGAYAELHRLQFGE